MMYIIIIKVIYMNLRQLHYAVLLAESGSFSHTAEKQGITQPALSKHILSLEKELGVQLFDRTKNPVQLTAAGEYLIREAKDLLYKEDMLLRSMEQFRLGDKGQLVIGITPFRSSYLIPDIVKKVRDKYPGVNVKLIEGGSEQIRHDAAEGKFDFAVVNLPVDETLMDIKPMEPDRLALVMSEDLYSAHPELHGKDRISFAECAYLPFVVLGTGQEMRRLFDKLCVFSEVSPDIVCEVNNIITASEIAVTGVGATLLPMQFVEERKGRGKLIIKELQNDIELRQPAVVCKKGQYISPYAEYAVAVLTGNK